MDGLVDRKFHRNYFRLIEITLAENTKKKKRY